jgi:triacylglycerol lipase
MNYKRKILIDVTSILSLLAVVAHADIDRGLTPHFSQWLKANGYGSFGFERTDLVGGAYGGKTSNSDVISHKPVIFFHGNSDIAVGTTYW